MAVAGGEIRALGPYRQKQCAALDQLLVVEIAAMGARLLRGDRAPTRGGGATPITPKNGASGSSVPQGRRQVRLARSIGMWLR